MLPFLTAALGIGGLIGGVIANKKQSQALKQYAEQQRITAELSAQQEAVRKEQMNLEFQRKQREIIRQTQAARSAALVAGANQGASQGSGVAGGVSSVVSQGAFNLNQNAQARDLGANIFDLNAQIARSQARAANFQGQASRYSTFGNLALGIGAQANTISNIFETTVGNIFGIGSDPYATATRKYE